MTTAVLDTCVLYRILLCDALLRLAAAGFFVPRWSESILIELERNLAERIDAARAERRVNQMRAAFPEAAIRDDEALIPEMTNDPKDRHVLAAAVATRALLLVTDNLDDFPPEATVPHQIEVVSADQFLSRLFEVDPIRFRSVLEDQAASYHHPPMTFEQFLRDLAAPSLQARLVELEL